MTIRRRIPVHPLELLAGCADDDARLVEAEIVSAIGVGAPLYNEGHHEACFRIYEGAALSLALRLEGPASRIGDTLRAGARAAAEARDATARAWAMRDAFDGMLDVIRRHLGDEADEPIERAVPDHEPALLEAVGDDQLARLVETIAAAIEVGAPAYNEGDADRCFAIYQAAARDLLADLEAGSLPARALADGLVRADVAGSAEAKAWAMRDAFDGLLRVIERRALN